MSFLKFAIYVENPISAKSNVMKCKPVACGLKK